MNHYARIVPTGVRGLDLLRFMRDAWPTAPVRELRAALKRRDVKLNGKRVAASCPLASGDALAWYTTWMEAEIPVVYEDDCVLIVNKPAGLPTDPQTPWGASLLQWAAKRLEPSGQPRLVHRLDQQTSGLVALALCEQSEALLLRWFRERVIQKEYTCLVGGQPPDQVLLTDYLIKDAANARVRVVQAEAPGSKRIITSLRLHSRQGELSRLLVCPHTGRTHQIRAHLAFHGWPILGDDKYGDRALNKRLDHPQLRLAATALTLPPGEGWPGLKINTWRIEAPF